ncbi:universal stress protein A-like protein isoform X1 [Macadamia integrifolia]|uniref:universal stress protein A-like protein isoform X1 n=1 Tax=Macadamia integrifolia TaxID=60698 RepID=UPI001C501817|nr:universal stress protein A-like protein isoform X1 [Macadamia integrifolia]
MAEEQVRNTSCNKKKVMVAIEESEFSHYALKWALENFNDCLSGSSLVIFTVQTIASVGHIYAASFGSARTYGVLSTNPDMLKSVQENKRKFSLALLEKAKEICAKQGVTAETITEIGDPKVAICDAVEKLNIDILILGSHGRGILKRAFMGSVSNYCVQNAKCPVLVIKKSK